MDLAAFLAQSGLPEFTPRFQDVVTEDGGVKRLEFTDAKPVRIPIPEAVYSGLECGGVYDLAAHPGWFAHVDHLGCNKSVPRHFTYEVGMEFFQSIRID